jgi:hypothetical protein
MEKTTDWKEEICATKIFEMILQFLQMLLPITLAKRVLSMALIAAGVPDSRVTELTGLCDRSVRALRKSLQAPDASNLFSLGGKRGKKNKLADVESVIIEEIKTGNYSSRQQIVDMVYEKHGIKTSLTAVSGLLKKKVSNV